MGESHALLRTNQQGQCTLEKCISKSKVVDYQGGTSTKVVDYQGGKSTRVVDRLTRDKAWARGDPPPQGKVSNRFLAIEMDLEGGSSTSALSPQKGIRDTWSLLVYDSPSSRMAAPCVQQHISMKWLN